VTTIAYPDPIPSRSAQANPFTALTHDDIHHVYDVPLRAVIDWINSYGIPGSSLPVGSITKFAGATAPAGFLLCNGQVVSRTTYANLFAVCSTVYNIGGESGADFRLPDLRGRAPIGINPMGGLTNGSYSTRTLGVVYGAESYTNAAVAVSGNSPSATVNFSNMGSVSFPSLNAGTYPALTGGVLPSSTGGSFPALTGGTLPSSSGGTLGSLTTNGAGTIASESKTDATVTAAACLKVTVVPEALDEAAQCSGMTVAAFTVNISKANILAALTFDGGSFPTFDPGAFQTLGAGSFPTFDPGAFQTLDAGTAPSLTGGSNSVTGAVATTAATALSGVTASISVPLIQPSLALTMIIKT
jgi:hypothetical protein